jgi:regulator of nonsense transcripts 2
VIPTESKPEPVIVTPTIEESKPIETPSEEPTPPVVEPPPEENLDLIRQQIISYFTERTDRYKQRQELREQNLQAEQNRLNAEQQQQAMSRLESSIKRIPPFIKRLRTLTEQQRDALCRDMQTLNLTRYISEVATSLTEAKLKMSDVWTSVQICSLLHQRYPDFSMSLYENWLKVLQKETLTDNLSKVRVDLRLFAELITVHVLPINQSINHLLSILTTLINNDKDFSNLTILISFCRLCGEDYADIFSNKIHKLIQKLDEKFDDTNPSTFHSNELKQQIRQMLMDYFQKLSIYLVEEHKQLQKQDQLMKRTLEVSLKSMMNQRRI